MKLNFPNFLILLRLSLVPIIIFLLLLPSLIEKTDFFNFNIGENIFGLYFTDIFAGLLFIFASLTDFVDGWYARKYNQITTFGKLFDPLADKILINSTLIIFGARGLLPIIFVIIFIIRDILVDGLRMMLASNDIVLAADKWGKLKTIFQMLGLTLLFFIHPVQSNLFFNIFDWTSWFSLILITPITIGMFFSILSGINYYKFGFKSLKDLEKND